eukprot:gene6029-6730_t
MPTFLQGIKDEFKLANFTFRWNSKDDFQQPVLKCLDGIAYVMIRWVFALYFIVAISLSLDYSGNRGWIFALTSWNYLFNTLYFVYAAITVTYLAFMKSKSAKLSADNQNNEATGVSRSSSERIGILLKIHWFLHGLSFNVCTCVFLMFWVIVAPGREGGYSPSMKTFLVIDRHGINLILLIIDFTMLTKIPFRILHCLYASIFIGLFWIYNAIYWSITKKLIYSAMDYGTKPGFAIGMILVAVLLVPPLIHFLWYLAHRLKIRCIGKLSEPDELKGNQEVMLS